MDMVTSNKMATGRGVQRSLFIGSLHKEMDKMERVASSRNTSLMKMAMSYIDEGCSEEEVIELLILDGYPTELSKNGVESILSGSKLASSEDVSEDCEWDFICKDETGKTWRGSEYGQTVFATTERDAITRAQEIVGSDSSTEEVIVNVERIGK